MLYTYKNTDMSRLIEELLGRYFKGDKNEFKTRKISHLVKV